MGPHANLLAEVLVEHEATSRVRLLADGLVAVVYRSHIAKVSHDIAGKRYTECGPECMSPTGK